MKELSGPELVLLYIAFGNEAARRELFARIEYVRLMGEPFAKGNR
jgi:hypothetical protein